MKLLFLLTALAGALVAQTVEGTWQGILIPPNQNGELRLIFKIARNGNAYQGVFYNLANSRGHHAPGERVKIAIPGNGMNYEGKIEADGNSITRTLLTQGNQGTNPLPLPLSLRWTRATATTAWELPGADALPDLFTAVQEQLGLKLDATKAPVDVLVIDKVSKPSEN
jgi:hypothetical protein